MSFSGDVKRELAEVMPEARHCMLAEIKALTLLLAEHETDENGIVHRSCVFRSEREEVARKLFTLWKKAFNINLSMHGKVSKSGGHTTWILEAEDPEQAEAAMLTVGHASVLRMECCRKAFLRGAFLAAGSISAPEKYYHLELVCPEPEAADLLKAVMESMDLDPRIVKRKKDYIVYLKEGDHIVSLLGAMGASVSFLNIETIRVMKEMRGSVNRRVNCETANLNKTVVSAVRQMEDIRYLRDHGGFSTLTPQLREMAEARLAYPDAPLSELGEYLEPKIGKSGVNHRLRKLSAAAEDLRQRLKDI
ncbi:MAG: DNA-binding protein WhiA [Lachnospiraceae bacterium]|nr:DNA-binding protein WhiA [Lachnospiraceae bacterium]